MSIRLNKLIAWRGVAARRKADELIAAGSVKVNGVVVRELGTMVDEERDHVMVLGRPLPRPQRLRWFMLHKPVGIISTVADPEGRRTVRDLLPTGTRVFPVGRLDADTSGLLLLTNDGPLAHRLMHPRYGVDKVYRVRLAAPPQAHQLRRLAQGVRFDEGMVSAPAQVRQIDPGFDAIMLEIRIHEGRFRQVRRMCEAVGLEVTGLHRVAYGPLRLGPLPRGEHRELTHEEVAMLRSASARPLASGPRKRGGRAADEAKRRALYMHGTDPDAPPESSAPERASGGARQDDRRAPWGAASAAPTRRGRPAPAMPVDEDEDEIEERWGPGAGGEADDRFDASWPVRADGRRGDADFVARSGVPSREPRESREARPSRSGRPARSERPARSGRPTRSERPAHGERPARSERPARGKPATRSARPGEPRRGRPDSAPRERTSGGPRARPSGGPVRGRSTGPRPSRPTASARGSTQRTDRRGPARPQRSRDATRRSSGRPAGPLAKRRGGGGPSPRRRKG